MKRLTLLLFIIVFLGGSLFAVDWGFKFGMGFTDLGVKETTDSIFEDFQFNTTELFCAFASFKVSDHFRICPELNYLLQGGKIRRDLIIETESGPTELRDKLTWRIYSFNFPLIFKFFFTPNKSLSPTIFAGPFVSVIVDSSWISESALGSYYDLLLENELPQRVDYGAIFGLGLDVKLDRFNVLLELRYRLGLRNLADPDNEIILDFSTRGFFINFGIRFGPPRD
jgi:hypothetical protein